VDAPRSFVEPLVLIAALWAVVFGALAWVLARRYDRAASLWAVFGVLLGPLAIAILRVAPPGRCPGCGARVQGWESTCLVCDRPLASRRRRSVKPAEVLEEVLIAPAEDPADHRPSGTGPLAAELPATGGRPSRRRRRQTAEAPQAPDSGTRPAGRMPAPDPTASIEPARITPVDQRSTWADPGTTTGGMNAARDRAPDRWTAARLRGRSADEPAEPMEPTPGEASGERPLSPPASPADPAQATTPAEPEARLVVVFVVGSESLVIGARYLLTVQDEMLMVLGPLDTAPGNVRVRRRTEELDVSVVSGQVLVTSRRGPRLALAFNAMPGQHPEQLERAVQQDTAQDASA
jgi:hypothetical protein